MGRLLRNGVGHSGGSIADPGDTPPSIRTLAWFDWFGDWVAYHEATAPTTSATTYYFSQLDGNDAQDGLTPETAKQTGVAASVLAAGGNVRIRFKRGGTYRFFDPTTPALAGANLILDDYGDSGDPKPVLTRFEVPDMNWQQDGANDTYTVKTTSLGDLDVAWLRIQGNSQKFIRATSVADCRSTHWSFYFDGTDLYVNFAGDNPEGLYTVETTYGCGTGDGVTEFVDIGCYGSGRIARLTIEGLGMHSQAGVIKSWGCVGVTGSISDRIVISEVDMTYCGYHGQSHLGNGYCLIRDCTIGWLRPGPGNGCTVMVAHSAAGGGKSAFHTNTILAGNLRDAGIIRSCDGIYGHTSGGTHNLIVAYNNIYENNDDLPRSPSGFADCPTWGGTWTSLRGFVVGDDYRGRDSSNAFLENQMFLKPSNQCQSRCRFETRAGGGTRSGFAAGNGALIESIVYVDGMISGGANKLLYHDSDYGGYILGNRIHYYGFGCVNNCGEDAVGWASTIWANNIFVCEWPDIETYHHGVAVNISNSAGNMHNNAFWCYDPVPTDFQVVPAGSAGAGAIGDSGKIVFPSYGYPVSADVPGPGDTPTYNPLKQGASATWISEYDYAGTDRGANLTIGPITV